MTPLRIETTWQFVHAAGGAVVILCWLLFAGVFLVRRSGPQPETRRRERTSIAGIYLQGIAFTLAWGVRRPTFTPFLGGHRLGAALVALEVLLAVGSMALTLAAVRTLGREWSFQARLVEGHRLVTAGPYGLVRHPIYTGMLGMLIATALAFAHPIGLLAALVFYTAGTVVRVRSEEKLLRSAFGASFEDYARRVPAVVPLPRG